MEKLTKEEIYELCIPLESELATTESGMNAHATCFLYKSCTYEKYRARYEHLRALHKKLMEMVPQEETTETEQAPWLKVQVEMSVQQARLALLAINTQISEINYPLTERQGSLTPDDVQQLADDLAEYRSLRESINLALVSNDK